MSTSYQHFLNWRRTQPRNEAPSNLVKNISSDSSTNLNTTLENNQGIFPISRKDQISANGDHANPQVNIVNQGISTNQTVDQRDDRIAEERKDLVESQRNEVRKDRSVDILNARVTGLPGRNAEGGYVNWEKANLHQLNGSDTEREQLTDWQEDETRPQTQEGLRMSDIDSNEVINHNVILILINRIKER